VRKRQRIMNKGSRRKFSAEFKAKVALEALQERETIEILCKKYDLHPNQVSQWKRSFKEEGSKVFEKSIGHDELSEKDRLIAELYRQIGELKVDNDWLKKKLR